MASRIYPRYKQALLSGTAGAALTTNAVRCILIDADDYTYSDSHEFLSSVPAAARVAVSGDLTGKTVTNGVFDCDDFTFSSVSGDQSEALLFYLHTGSDATARLVAYIDSGYTGLPVTPNGADINVVVPATGVFTL